MNGSKVCRRCGEAKPLDEYGVDRHKRDGRHTQCQACRRAHRAEYRAARRRRDRERVAEEIAAEALREPPTPPNPPAPAPDDLRVTVTNGEATTMPSGAQLNPAGVGLFVLALFGPPATWGGHAPDCCTAVGGLCDLHRSRLVGAAISHQRGGQRRSA